MKKNNANQDTNNTLRQKAEAKLGNKKQAVIQDIQTDKANSLFHELQVHQVELVMQNEELKHANTQAENALSKYYDIYDLAPVRCV